MLIGIICKDEDISLLVASVFQILMLDKELSNYIIKNHIEAGTAPNIDNGAAIASFRDPLYRAAGVIYGTSTAAIKINLDSKIEEKSPITYRQVVEGIETELLKLNSSTLHNILFRGNYVTRYAKWQKKVGPVHAILNFGYQTLCETPCLGNNYASDKDEVTCESCLKIMYPDLIITDVKSQSDIDIVREKGGLIIEVLTGDDNQVKLFDRDLFIWYDEDPDRLIDTIRRFLIDQER